MHEHKEEETGDRQAFDEHGQQRRIVFRNEHDEINGQRLEEGHQFRPDALQLNAFFVRGMANNKKGREDNQDKH